MQSLVPEFLRPELPVNTEYVPGTSVAAWCFAEGLPLVFEVFARSAGSYGAKCQAWVAFRDAGSNVHAHSWYEIAFPSPFVAESLGEAKHLVEAVAATHSLALEPWVLHGQSL